MNLKQEYINELAPIFKKREKEVVSTIDRYLKQKYMGRNMDKKEQKKAQNDVTEMIAMAQKQALTELSNESN